jgi:hypothetical protein
MSSRKSVRFVVGVFAAAAGLSAAPMSVLAGDGTPAPTRTDKQVLEDKGYVCGRMGIAGYLCTKSGSPDQICDNAGTCTARRTTVRPATGPGPATSVVRPA